MNYRIVGKYMGYILFVEGLFMIPALLVAMGYHEPDTIAAFIPVILVCLALGGILARTRSRGSIGMGEGFVICSLGWIVMSLFGALPFFLSRRIPRFIDCWFETVSGFTTTGSSILTNVEGLTYGLFYWRSFTHWIGGMGVLVFLLAVVPLAKGNGEPFNLMRAESPGPAVGHLRHLFRAYGAGIRAPDGRRHALV